MQYLRVKNFDKYQHYKTRNPPWVKLYRCILNDYEYRLLPTPSRLLYIFCIILASESDNRIPHDPNFLSARCGLTVDESVITPLIDSGFLLACGARRLLAHDALCSSLLSSVSLNPLSSLKTSDLKSNGDASEFEQFWRAYPRKVGKKKAQLAWEKAKDKPELVDMLQVLEQSKHSEQWTKENGQFIPHPSTWINEGRWADEATAKPLSTTEAFLLRGTHDTTRLS